jgi:hypothetical protein
LGGIALMNMQWFTSLLSDAQLIISPSLVSLSAWISEAKNSVLLTRSQNEVQSTIVTSQRSTLSKDLVGKIQGPSNKVLSALNETQKSLEDANSTLFLMSDNVNKAETDITQLHNNLLPALAPISDKLKEFQTVTILGNTYNVPNYNYAGLPLLLRDPSNAPTPSFQALKASITTSTSKFNTLTTSSLTPNTFYSALLSAYNTFVTQHIGQILDDFIGNATEKVMGNDATILQEGRKALDVSLTAGQSLVSRVRTGLDSAWLEGNVRLYIEVRQVCQASAACV